jgi:uncharacterized protein (DUF1499 family)
MLAGFGSRVGWWHFRTGFQLLTWAAYGGLGGAVLAVAGGLTALQRGDGRRVMLSLVALAVGLLVVWVPWQMKQKAARVPAIHDITTDTENPPRFVAVLPLRQGAPNSVEYEGPAVAGQQQAAYPDIKTLTLRGRGEEVFTHALRAAEAMGWDIAAADQAEGRIEATDTTFWFGFKDDIVVRIRARDDEHLVDVRSVSRVGKSDVGTNAERIREYIAKLADAEARS